MSQTKQAPLESTVGRTHAEHFARRVIKPVKWWAALGCAYLALGCYSVTRWIAGGHARSVSTGSDPVPTYMWVTARAEEAFFTGLAVVVIYRLIVKPWRAEHRMTTDGLVLLALGTLWLQDPLPNYGQVAVTFNATFYNLGCPQCFLPGWMSNGADFVEPPLYAGMFYLSIIWIALKGGSMVITRAQVRWPRLGAVGAIGLLLMPVMAFEFITEFFWLRTGQYVWSSASGGTGVLFAGHFYAFPIWELLAATVWYTSLIVCMHFRNDKGQMFAERGIDAVRGTGAKRSGLRLLAYIGMFQTALLLCYNLPVGLGPSLHWNRWSDDVQKRSYLLHGVCGPGSDTACPDPRLPIPKAGSARLGPDGNLIAPDGVPVAPKGSTRP